MLFEIDKYVKTIYKSKSLGSSMTYKCEECGLSFNSLEELEEHNNERHVAMP